MRKYNKGQALVEFALVLPFFLLFVFGIIYSGMMFYDYSTLSNVARSAARERAITAMSTDNDTIEGYYFDQESKRFKYGLVTSLYRLNDFSIVGPETNNPDIVVTVTMELDSSTALMRMVLPPQYSVVYHMRKDSK